MGTGTEEVDKMEVETGTNEVETLDLTKPIAEQLAGKKVRIESVEHLDYVGKVSGINIDSIDGKTDKVFRGLHIEFGSLFPSNTDNWFYDYDDLEGSTAILPEIKIPLPSIQSRVLAEKVSDGSTAVNVEFYHPEPIGVQVNDMIKKPNHYQLLPEYEVKDVNKALLDKIELSDFDMSLYEAGWYQQAMQYFMRFYAKNGLEDLEKGIETMQIVIDSLKQRAVAQSESNKPDMIK